MHRVSRSDLQGVGRDVWRRVTDVEGFSQQRAVLIKALSEYTKETGGASREGSDGWWVGKSSSKSELVEVPAGGKAAAAPAPVARGLTEPPTVGVTADSLDTKDHGLT